MPPTHSKDMFWLEKAIWDLIDKFTQKRQDAASWILDKQNRNKIIAALVIGVGGGYGLARLYKYLTYKPRAKQPQQAADKKEQEKKPQARIDKAFFERLWYLVKIACPRFKSREFGTASALALTVVAQSLLGNYLNELAGELMKHLVMQNVNGFNKLLLWFTTVNLFISFIAPFITYLMDNLSLDFRKNITEHIHSKYYQNIMYYKLKSLDKRISNPDQIVTQDVEVLCDKISSLFVDFLSPLSEVIINSVRMTEIIGIGGPISIFLYLLTSFLILSIVTPNFTKMSAEVQAREGKFRFLHGRLRINAESIAFYQGDNKERNIVENIFKNLTDYANVVINKNFVFGIVNDYFTKYCPHTVVVIIAGLPTFFGGLRTLNKGELLSVLRYLIAVISYEFLAVGKLIELFRILLKLSGYTHRVYSLLDVMKDIYRKQREDKTIKGTFEDSEDIEFDGVSIVTPANVPLAHRLKFVIKHGRNTVITGPNGAGKSRLFRVLGGLWPLKLGTVRKPGATKQGLNSTDIFYLPQKPYNVIVCS
jgi:ATP-binding cassette subfamily D (ALD) protein 3